MKKPSMVWPGFLIVVAGLMTLRADAAHAADVVFDSYTPPHAWGGYSSPANGVATEIAVAQTVRISGFSILNESYTANRFRFLIMSEPGHDLLYLSPPKSFPADGTGVRTWKDSDAVDFLLVAGERYLVGYVRESAAGDFVDNLAESSNGITSALFSHTIGGFNEPTYGHRYVTGADQSVRLLAIPEPAVAGLVGLALAMRVRAAGPRR